MLILLFYGQPSFGRLEDIFKGETSIKKPFDLRDPFQAPKFKSEKSRARTSRYNGKMNNIPKLKTEFNVENINVVGVLIGKERRVLIKSANQEGSQVYTLKEGEVMGTKGPEIKAILPGGVILVEKITNVYGENEFIETVIPISK